MILSVYVPTWTDDEIATLRAAVASGVLTVSYSGPPARTITYQKLSDMKALLDEMTASAASSSGTGTPYRLAATRKGLGY